MINMSRETVALAERLAAAQRLPVEDAVRLALEDKAKTTGVPLVSPPSRRRASVAQMLAAGDEIAAMPLLDPRSPGEILDDLNVL